MDYNEVWFHNQLFMKKLRKSLQGVLIFIVCQKHQIKLKLTFSSLLSNFILNATHVLKFAIEILF